MNRTNVKFTSWPVKLSSNMFVGFLLLNHVPVEGAAKFGWGDAPERDDDLLARVCDYFEKRSKEEIYPNSEVWDPIVATHADFVKLLRDRDYEKLHEYISMMFTKNITSGTAQGTFYYNQFIKNDGGVRDDAEFTVYDKLITLLESCNMIPTFSPEDYLKDQNFLKYFTVDPDKYLSILEESCNADLCAPKYQGGLFGLKTEKHGLYCDRDIMCLGVAIRVLEAYSKNRNISICDIGGGVGHLEYYLSKLGFTNITMVDLPTVSTTAKYFLETNLPEKVNDINLISPSEFTGEYDLVINFDGLVTYGKDAAKEYTDKISKNAKHFISVNKEVEEFRMCDILNMTRVSRNPFWHRRGYVEENYVSSK